MMQTDRQQLRVIQIEQINAWVRRYRLAPADSHSLAPFLAGQYLNLFYEIDGATTCRPYSIASSPGEAQQGYYDLYIHGGGSFTSPWALSLRARGRHRGGLPPPRGVPPGFQPGYPAYYRHLWRNERNPAAVYGSVSGRRLARCRALPCSAAGISLRRSSSVRSSPSCRPSAPVFTWSSP